MAEFMKENDNGQDKQKRHDIGQAQCTIKIVNRFHIKLPKVAAL
jgi:hypothetical protein